MYARLQTHTNTTESRKHFAVIVQGIVARDCEILRQGQRVKKGVTIAMIKKGYYDGWHYEILRDVSTGVVMKINIIYRHNVNLLPLGNWHKIA